MDAFMHQILAPMAISKQERAFFAELGERIAQRRRDQAITQAQLAAALSVSYQPIQAMERIRRLPKAKQRFVMEILKTVLTQASR